METIAAIRQQTIAMTDNHQWGELRGYMMDLIANLPSLRIASAAPIAQWLVECAEQCCLPPNVIAPLADLRGGNSVLRQAFRTANGAELNKLTIIPVGCECHPWVIMNRWGFRADLSSLNHLCLGIHRMPGLLPLMADRFAGYARPETMTTRTHPNSGLEMAVDDTMGITWNHHRGDYWTADGFAKLRNSSAALIDTFHRDCAEPDAIFAISQWRGFDPNAPALDQFLDALSANGATNPKLIVMDFSGATPNGLHSIRQSVCLIGNPYPDGYSWSGMDYYNSDRGYAWEAAVVKYVLAACQRLDGLPSSLSEVAVA